MTVGLAMTDKGLEGGSSFEFAPDLTVNAVFLSRATDPQGVERVVAAIAPVDMALLDLAAVEHPGFLDHLQGLGQQNVQPRARPVVPVAQSAFPGFFLASTPGSNHHQAIEISRRWESEIAGKRLIEPAFLQGRILRTAKTPILSMARKSFGGNGVAAGRQARSGRRQVLECFPARIPKPGISASHEILPGFRASTVRLPMRVVLPLGNVVSPQIGLLLPFYLFGES